MGYNTSYVSGGYGGCRTEWELYVDFFVSGVRRLWRGAKDAETRLAGDVASGM